jgi:LysR family transcriptional regulator, low CO2-responsive transcriptional regulator
MINLHHLRVFYMTARHLSCTAAAERLYITQPAVTAQIKRFEEQCSLKLFKRKGRNLFLTDEGRALLDYAKRIFACEKELENVIEEMRELKRGVLRLGTTKTYARYFMPFLVSNFHEAYPHIKIHLDEGSSADMIHSLVGLKNEVAVIARAEENPDVRFIPFSQEELVVILAPDHPLASRDTIPVHDLAEEPIIMKELGSGTRKKVNALFAQNQCTPEILMETSNAEFIKELVHRGEGVSFLVREAVSIELREKKLATVPLEGQTIHLDVSIAYLKNQNLSLAAQAFVDILLKISQEKPVNGLRDIMARVFEHWK